MVDLTTIIGIGFAISLILTGILVGGSGLQIYVNIPGFCITILGGTFSALAGFMMTDWLSIPRVLRKALTVEPQPIQKLIADLVRYAEIARRDGILALEGTMEEMEEGFLKRGLQLAVDGTDPELIHQMLNTELEYLQHRHERARKMFEAAADNFPSFGMVGTLIGLVGMLMHLDDPKKLGPEMAVGLLATFYGVSACYVVFKPIAKKLEVKSKEETMIKEMIIRGVMSIQSGDNPRVVEQKLRIFLPPAARAAEKVLARK